MDFPPITEKGKIYLYGNEVKIKSPYDAIKLGMAFLSENRKRESGMFQNFGSFAKYSDYKIINRKQALFFNRIYKS